MLMSHYSATPWLLATGIVSLKHCQVTRTALELAPFLLPNFSTTPMRGHLYLNIFNAHSPTSARWVISSTTVEFMTRRSRILYLDHYTTAAT
ncbi:hypothetical protein TNCV_3592471 [Trichonephila clavipes]|nr:hypothetical protein TNCV_3592471 [Trichonephila clavipes]